MAKMIDRIKVAVSNAKFVRNIAICAHIDHGKTTFSDNLLSGAGMMSEELAGKARTLDFHDDETERGITIDSAAVSMVHTVKGDEYLINLIDTPGHVDFGGDVTRAMRAVDGAIVLACAVEGVMPQTETVLRQALRENVKPILFINKVDRLIKELQLTPEAMQERFMKVIEKVNELIVKIAGEELGAKWRLNVADGSVCFGSAFHNWGLSVPYMQANNVGFKEVIDAYNKDEWKDLKKIAPIHKVVLDAVIVHLPSPLDAQPYRIPKIWHGDKDSEFAKQLAACDPNGAMTYVVTKIVVDPQAGEIATGRVFSGTIKKGMSVKLAQAKMEARIQQVYIYNGAKKEIIESVPAGNIVGVGGLRGAYPGDTVSEGDVEPFEQISHIFDPVITKAIEPKKPSDLPKLIEVLTQVGKEDPSVKIYINQETGEYLISGMGELHLEVIENRIVKEKHMEVVTSPPVVVYRETVHGKNAVPAEGKSPNKHNKLYFTVEPCPQGLIEAVKRKDLPQGRIKKKDLELWASLEECGLSKDDAKRVKDIYEDNLFLECTRGVVHIGEILEMVLDMFEDVMRSGGLAREPCTGVLVRLVDVKLHEDAIHRGPAQMYPAIREGIRLAMRQAKPVLNEPIQTTLFEAPTEYMGEISKLISNKRGQLLDMEDEGGTISVTAKMPVAETFGMSSDLRSATGGRGTSSLVDQNFEMLPMEMQDKIRKQIRERKGLKDD